jgi:molybdenum cofactor synthesis domain-containing protein
MEFLDRMGGTRVDYRIVPDEIEEIQKVLISWCDELKVQLVVTTGGTGPHPRDVTPDATEPLLARKIPGMAEVMRSAGLRNTPHAMLSRAVAGIRGRSLIINLPGSPTGALESLEAVAPALPHALEKIAGDDKECATPQCPSSNKQST